MRPITMESTAFCIAMLLSWLGATGCNFQADVDATASLLLSCSKGGDCPDQWGCLLPAGRCVQAGARCVVFEPDGATASAAEDGLECGQGTICVSGACVVAWCGDGVVTGQETCDSSAGCRADCTRCGDGVLDEGEVCDEGAANSDVQPNACRTTCVPHRCGDGVRDLGEGCDEGRGNSDDQSGTCRTNCALSSCGDGVVDPGEGCDDGAENSDARADACRTTCVPARCGDGTVDEGESCDEGAANSDVQPNACRTSCVLHRCGDGVRDLGEGCDEGRGNSDEQSGTCRTNCALSSCGDGVVDPGEGCDAGSENSDEAANACRTTCEPARCGDGVVDELEECDAGAANSDVQPNACRTTCVSHLCGDGVRDLGEGCDDGRGNSDGQSGTCRTNCALPSCGDGVVDPGEGCDEGAGNSDERADACRTTCEPARCGDGVVDDSEECDAGAANSDVQPNACRTACVPYRCGDGVRDLGEECDEGQGNSDERPSTCRTSCALPSCGDSVLDQGEICDDGNVRSGDGCRADCAKLEVCGDSVVDQGEACDDRNENPVDGCDQCRLQSWTREVVVGQEARAGLRTGLILPMQLSIDPYGRIFFAVSLANRAFRLDPDGTVSPVAGDGKYTNISTGDGGPALRATFLRPHGVAVDPLGRVLITDEWAGRLRRVERNGNIGTVASLSGPSGLFVTKTGLIFVSETQLGRVRRLNHDDTLAVVATGLNQPKGLVVDKEGVVFVAESGGHRVRRIDPSGAMTVVAGTGVAGFAGDDALAVQAQLNVPFALALDDNGSLYIADRDNHRVRRVGSDGVITTVAGTGVAADTGDGGPATEAALNGPMGLVFDTAGRLVIADSNNNRLRRIDAHGTIQALVGVSSDLDEPALSRVAKPTGFTFDSRGRYVIADRDFHRIRRVDPHASGGGLATTIVGDAPWGFAGDGQDARAARLAGPLDATYDEQGRLYVADSGNRRIRGIGEDNIITTLAGSGEAGLPQSGVPATASPLGRPRSIAISSAGELWFVDEEGHAVVRVDGEGVLHVVAGALGPGNTGDGGQAHLAKLNAPSDLLFDQEGALLIVDTGNHVVRRIDLESGVIDRYVGAGVAGYLDGPPLTARLNGPVAIAQSMLGELCIADRGNRRIRCLDPGLPLAERLVRTVAGTGVTPVAGDGGQALDAALGGDLRGLGFADDGQLYFTTGGVQESHQRLMRIDLDGVMTTVVGQVHPRGNGPAPLARLYGPRALTTVGDRVLGVGEQSRIQLWDRTSDEVSVAAGFDSAASAVHGLAAYAPLFSDARGIAYLEESRELVVTEYATSDLRIIGLDPDGDGEVDAPGRWTHARLPTTLEGPAGLAYDPASDQLLVVDQQDHCVVRVTRQGEVLPEPVYGTCGAPGSFPGFLRGPTQLALSPLTGAVYVSDTDNHRVLRIDTSGDARLVVGDGSVSSAGEGAPARLFPVNAPQQLALDGHGNLYIASTTTVRLVANIDGDLDADGDDRVLTIFGGGERLAFPESDAFCIQALTLDDNDALLVSDACQGFLTRLVAATVP